MNILCAWIVCTGKTPADTVLPSTLPLYVRVTMFFIKTYYSRLIHRYQISLNLNSKHSLRIHPQATVASPKSTRNCFHSSKTYHALTAAKFVLQSRKYRLISNTSSLPWNTRKKIHYPFQWLYFRFQHHLFLKISLGAVKVCFFGEMHSMMFISCVSQKLLEANLP